MSTIPPDDYRRDLVGVVYNKCREKEMAFTMKQEEWSVRRDNTMIVLACGNMKALKG